MTSGFKIDLKNINSNDKSITLSEIVADDRNSYCKWDECWIKVGCNLIDSVDLGLCIVKDGLISSMRWMLMSMTIR